MRAVVLRGEHPRRVLPQLNEGLRFLVRLRAGIGGVCPSGRIVAFTVWGPAGSEQVVFLLWMTPFRQAHLPPILVVTSADFSLGDAEGELDVLPYPYLAGIP